MSIVSTAVSVTGTATALPASGITGPTTVRTLIYNNGTATIYVGGSDVTTSNGIPIEVGSSLGMDVTVTETLYGIAASGTHNVRVLEVA
jgi:hypothetical protein